MRIDEVGAILLSLKASVTAVVFMFPLALAAGWYLARRGGAASRILESLLTLPVILPPVVTGYVLLILFAPAGRLGGLLEGIGLRFVLDWKGASLAAGVVAFPFMVLGIRVAIENVEPGLEAAARTLGAGRARIFATITLPLARGGVAAGVLVAFARAFGEFGATLMVAGNIPGQTQTVPLAIYSALLAGRDSQARSLVLITVLFALAASYLGGYLFHREKRRSSGAEHDSV